MWVGFIFIYQLRIADHAISLLLKHILKCVLILTKAVQVYSQFLSTVWYTRAMKVPADYRKRVPREDPPSVNVGLAAGYIKHGVSGGTHPLHPVKTFYDANYKNAVLFINSNASCRRDNFIAEAASCCWFCLHQPPLND